MTNMEKARLDKGLKIVELAKLCGYSHVSIIGWEKGHRQASKLALWTVGKALEVPEDERLELQEECVLLEVFESATD